MNIETTPDASYVETLIARITQGKTKLSAIDVMSTGEQIAVCLAVGNSDAVATLLGDANSSFRIRYLSLGDAWSRIDETHRAYVLNAWAGNYRCRP